MAALVCGLQKLETAPRFTSVGIGLALNSDEVVLTRLKPGPSRCPI